MFEHKIFMFSSEFLTAIADTHGLTLEQKKVFLYRFLDNKSHLEIAKELGINSTSSLRRMTEVYKKFDLKEKGKLKDSELRKYLISRYNIQEKNDLTHYISVNNLPAYSNKFIGRKNELENLLRYLSDEFASPIINVDGIAGVGKTALILEAANLCLKAKNMPGTLKMPVFEAIIFISAKEDVLLPLGIYNQIEVDRNLSDIFKEISLTLNEPSIIRETGLDQLLHVKRILRNKKILLIVDNLETINSEEKNKIYCFLKELPRSVKTVITTREQTVIHMDIRLENLPEEDGLELIKQQASEKSILLTEDESKKLYQASGGIPLAIVYAVGRLANSVELNVLLNDLKSRNGDLARFLFQKDVNEIKEQSAYKVLMAISIFCKDPLINAVREVAGINDEPNSIIQGSFEKLQQISLVRRHNGRFTILSPTREYALSELNINKKFQKEARKRWLKWYLDFAAKHGGDDLSEWHEEYDKIEEEWDNFLEVLDWYANDNQFNIDQKECYENINKLWTHLNKFASLYGHWDDRLRWLDWLITKSQRYADWITYVNSITSKSWTLILKESPENLIEAEKLLNEAWSRIQNVEDNIRYIVAENMAVINIRKQEFDTAREWFIKYCEIIENSNLDYNRRCRSKIRCLYYEAEILYREKKVKDAQLQYQRVLKEAEDIQWLRFVVNAQSWLATIAIKLQQFDNAENILKDCMPVAERNKDKRRTAVCQYTYARLELERKNYVQAERWALLAKDGFERLGIKRDAEDVYHFIANIPKVDV
jgi:NB-ARC domain